MRIDDAIWAKIFSFLSSRPDTRTCSEVRCRKFVEAVFWMVRRCQWRYFHQKMENGIPFINVSVAGMMRYVESHAAHFAADPDMESVLIDSQLSGHPWRRVIPRGMTYPRRTIKLWDVLEAVSAPKSIFWWMLSGIRCNLY